jgi:hypothetical protein
VTRSELCSATARRRSPIGHSPLERLHGFVAAPSIAVSTAGCGTWAAWMVVIAERCMSPWHWHEALADLVA